MSNKFKGAMRCYEITQKDLAVYLSISIATCNKKVNNISDFTIGEAMCVKELLNSKGYNVQTIDEIFI